MQEQHPTRARQRRGFTLTNRALAVAAALLLVGALAACGTGTTSKQKKVAVPAIHFHFPKPWGLLPKVDWAKIGAPSRAAAVLQRHGNSANLVVLRGGKAVVNNKMAQKINNQLSQKYSDYHFISAKAIKLPHITGKAMLFTYGRTKQGVLHTITIIPAPPISFVIETASPPNSKAIAREIGAILKTARLTYSKKK